MTDYSTAICPVCKQGFSDSRPLICPDCGAPYHRACWDKTGKCAFDAEHKNGFVWSDKAGTENTEHSIQPEASLGDSAEERILSELRETLEKMGFFEQGKAPSPDERFIFGVSEKEIAYFQGTMNPMRFIKYRQFAMGKRISFNIFAGIFSPYYIFYARMRMAGVFIALLTFLLNLPGALDIFFYVTNIKSPFTAGDLQSVSDILGYISLAMMIVITLFFDYFYLLWTTNRIKFIRNQFLAAASDLSEASESAAPPEASVPSDLPDSASLISPENEKEYFKCLQNAGKPSFLYMLLDGLAVTAAMSLVFYIILYTVWL